MDIKRWKEHALKYKSATTGNFAAPFLSDFKSHNLQWSITAYPIAEYQSYHLTSCKWLINKYF